MKKRYIKVLLIESLTEDREALRTKLHNAPGLECEVLDCSSGETAIGESARFQPDCVILGRPRPGRGGAEWLSRFHAGLPPSHLPVILIADRGGEDLALSAIGFGAEDYVLRSEATPESLQKAVLSAIDKVQMRLRLEELNTEVDRSRRREQESQSAERSISGLSPEDIRRRLARAPDLDTMIATLARLCVPELAELCVIDLHDARAGKGMFVRLASVHTDPAQDRIARQLIGMRGTFGVRDHAVLSIQNAQAQDLIGSAESALVKVAEALAPYSLVSVPLTAQGQQRGDALGVVTFVRTETSPLYSSEELIALERFCRAAAWAVECAQLRDSLRDSERRTNDAVSKLAHEIRNPLAPLKNALQILRLKGDDAPTRSWAQEIMERQVEKLVMNLDGWVTLWRSKTYPSGEAPAPETPIEASSPPPAGTQETKAPGTRRHVLVVDDNPDVAQSLAMVVELCGHAVDIAHDGASALEQARRHPPDVVFLDIGLPGMDGYDVARAIRQDALMGKPVLVALTGYGTDEARRKSSEAGFDHHLLKPVSLETVESLLIAKPMAEKAQVITQ